MKLFVLNNGGYVSMRTTQSGFFGRLVGEGPSSGISFPDIVRVAEAYDLPAARAQGSDFAVTIRQALASEGPFVCDVVLDPQQQFEPKLGARALADGRMASPALEDMSPFLPRAELLENLEIPPWEDG